MVIEETFAKVAEKALESKIDESLVKTDSFEAHDWSEQIPDFNESDSHRNWEDEIPDFESSESKTDWGNDIPDFGKSYNEGHIGEKEMRNDSSGDNIVNCASSQLSDSEVEPMRENDSPINSLRLQENNQDKLEKQETDVIGVNREEENPASNLDDNGNEYKDADGNLLPNTEYEINGVKYQTDENGRIISWDGKLQDTPENGRDNDAQKEAGGSDRQEGDHGGHLVARMNGGAEGNENMVAMRGHINQSDYKRGENEENQMLKDGKEVNESGKVSYDGDSSRPSKIEKTYTDGDKTVKATYDNEVGSTDLLNNLDGTITQEDLDSLKDEVSDMQADGNVVSVTSVTNEYDSEGELTKTTVGVRNETTGEKEFKTYNH